ncbi:MAG TPA: PAS domain S-box protein, partial [Blastocatellia bacterium]|nr:PAS domain S-box protein [Blastocatellia bacterium]
MVNMETLPLTNIRFLRQYNPGAISSRVRLRGTVTMALPSGGFFIRDDMNGIRVQSANTLSVKAGDQVEVIGVPIFEAGAMVMQDSMVNKLGSETPPEPVEIKAEQGLDVRYDLQYVTFNAEFIGRIPSADGYTYLLQSGALIFNAVLPVRTATDGLANVQKGSLVRITGICVVKYQNFTLGTTRQLPGSFDLLLPSAESIVVLQDPPWWNVQRAMWLLTVAVIVGLLAAAWVLMLRRRVHHQTAVIRKQMESEAALEERFRNLFENAQDSVYTMDLQGRFTSINKAGELLIGYSEEEFKQMTIADIVAAECLSSAQAALKRKIEGESTPFYEVEILTKDGRRITLEVNSTIIAEQDGNSGILAIARDITARKQIEAELQRARDEALQSAKLKSEFLANMSHEIRTPMNGIIGMTELALETQITPEQHEYLTTVKSSADALLTVINDILDFSKIEAGKMDLDCTDFNLQDSLHEAIRPLAFKASEKEIEIVCDIAPDVPELIAGDSGRLRQVLINLIGNAIKFTERGEVALKVQLA